MEPIPMSEGVVNILILGSDTRPGFYGSRTDTVMILSLDPHTGRARMISIPRDLYVYLPGWKVNRINTADQHGGPELVAMAIYYNLGIEIHHWVRVSFNGFITAVNALGGIDVYVERTIVDECDEQPVRFPAGWNHLNGYRALCYARVRKTSSDFDRARRQQQVLRAMFDRVLTLHGLSKVPELYSQFSNLVETDMTFGDLVPLIPLGTQLASDPSRIEGYVIDTSLAEVWRVPKSGAWVLLPKREELRSFLMDLFSP
jgi:LCP family protein required for cell wall assembly